MVCADNFSFWPRNFSAGAAHRSVPDAGWHFLCGSLVYGTGRDRTKIRHSICAPDGHGPRVCATACTRILQVFHLAPFQTHTRKRGSKARTLTRSGPLARQPQSPRFLERGGEGPPLFPGRNVSVAG